MLGLVPLHWVIMVFVPTNILGAVSDVKLNDFYWQAVAYSEYIPLLPQNPFKIVHEYDQSKDKSCVVFSAGSMITYNTGLQFTNEELREMWQEYQGNEGGNIFKTTQQIGQRFMLEHFPVDAYGQYFEKVLDKGYAIQVSLSCGPDVLVDGANDGIMEGDYTPMYLVPFVYHMPTIDHAIMMRRDTTTRKTYFQNTWPQ